MNRTIGLMSLCRRAGKLKIGFDSVKDAVNSGEAELVIFTSDFSPRSRARMDAVLADIPHPPRSYTVDFTMYDLSQVCGKLAGVVAIADKGFSDGIEKLICADNKEE